ncbi:hypothetical protein [Pontibacter harenae]|uniref:hypothetical protein n=1 Tax=Pontibacter harenae TaxID=2894083 RepID=UPI001E658910|nr:hypothetical protein [Pontibacter harenae]
MIKASFILVTLLLISCSSKTEEQRTEFIHSAESMTVKDYIILQRESSDTTGTVPTDGKYIFNIAFAEWDRKSMGEKVTVIIWGDSIRVTYEGDGTLTAGKGEVLDEGVIMKHKTGNWIIAREKEDVSLDEIGGCTGGPTIVDFKNKKYWMC